jgi:hypothetical protein
VSLPSGANVTGTAGQVFQLSSLLSASDADNDTLTYYVLDSTVGANTGHLKVNGVQQTDGQWIQLTQTQLSQTTFTNGLSGGDDIYLSVYDASSNALKSVHVGVTGASPASPVAVGNANAIFGGTHESFIFDFEALGTKIVDFHPAGADGSVHDAATWLSNVFGAAESVSSAHDPHLDHLVDVFAAHAIHPVGYFLF